MTHPFSADVLRKAIRLSLESLRASRVVIDAANVYPVPDSDTGTNLVATFEGIEAELGRAAPEDIPRAIKAGALRGARGNSGVIVAQILRAFADAVQDGPLDASTLRGTFARATDLAYDALLHPVEGTILTVMRAASNAAQSAPDDVEQMFRHALDAGLEALGHTPEQRPELARAGVLDAGGIGLIAILNAFVHAFEGAADPSPDAAASTLPAFMSKAAEVFAAASGVPLDEIDVVHPRVGTAVREMGSPDFALEVQYLLRASHDAIAPLRAALGEIGDSVAVTGGDGHWRVHVHTNDQVAAIASGERIGEISDVEVVRFEDQIARNNGRAMPDHEPSHTVPLAVAAHPSTLIAVAAGGGVVRLFSELGAMVLDGGDRVNASEDALRAAISAAPTQDVIVLPNDDDVYARAMAVTCEGKKIEVLRSTDQAEGLAAAIGFGDARDAASNIEEMKSILQDVRTGAVADLPVGASSVEGGDAPLHGFAEGELVASGDDAVEIAVDVVMKLIHPRAELITILAGKSALAEDRLRLRHELTKAFPRTEVQIHDGGQELHRYLIAVE